MKKCKLCIYLVFIALTLTSCAAIPNLTSSNMNKLELGMSKQQVTKILGSGYTIAEKRMEMSTEVEVLSYRDFYQKDELYMFVFKNGKLEKWYRQLAPTERVITSPNNSSSS